ncbi:MAG: aldo/keto reductase [Anaerolineae bacterium]|jgi:aryl-alcohol dehydrogenase-like predicted oxidoreductase
MEIRKLGRTGLEVSELALGTMQFGWTADDERSFAIMDAYVDAGGNLIDTADVYSSWAEGNPGGVSEEIIGRWMRERGNRHDLVLATKVRGRMWAGANGEGLSRAHIMRAAEDSLRRLQTDYIDLYQTHWYDETTPVEETMRALDDLVRAGKVRYIGCSNHPAWRLIDSLWTSERYGLERYVSLQPHYNLVHRQEFEEELALVTEKYGIGIIPYSPQAGGFLTGKYRPDSPLPGSARAQRIQEKYYSERNFALLDKMQEIGRAHDQGIAQVSLAWLLGNPLVTAPIIGANSVEQLSESMAVVGLRLDDEEMRALDDLSSWRED